DVERLKDLSAAKGGLGRNDPRVQSVGAIEAEARIAAGALAKAQKELAKAARKQHSRSPTAPTTTAAWSEITQPASEKLSPTVASMFFGPEQLICYVLFLWTAAILLLRPLSFNHERRQLDRDWLQCRDDRVL